MNERIVDRRKTVTWMDTGCGGDALGAEVPVGAVEALVAYTDDRLEVPRQSLFKDDLRKRGVKYLIAAIANSGVVSISASIQKGGGARVKRCLGGSRLEFMAWVMSVLLLNMARNAKVVVLTCLAGDKLSLAED